MLGKLPSDDIFEKINPYEYRWLYESWIAKMEMEMERLRHHGILIGSFYNPEAANKLAKRDRPDFQSTEGEDIILEKAIKEAALIERDVPQRRISRRKARGMRKKLVKDN